MKSPFRAAILFFALTSPALAQDAESAFLAVKSPEELVKYLSSEFTFEMKLPDNARTREETLRSRTGDCDDFARLASEALERIGIENEVLVLKFKGLSVYHAICMWKGEDGFYNFISSRKIHRTGERTPEKAVKKFYPDCERIMKFREDIYAEL